MREPNGKRKRQACIGWNDGGIVFSMVRSGPGAGQQLGGHTQGDRQGTGQTHSRCSVPALGLPCPEVNLY